MYFNYLKKLKVVYLLTALVIIFVVVSVIVKAEVDTLLPDEKNIELATKSNGIDEESYRKSEDEVFDYESFRSGDDYKSNVIKDEQRIRKNSLEIRDSAFTSDQPVTLKTLVVKVFLIVLVLLGILLAVKVFLFRNRFEEPGNVIDNFVQKFASTFSNNTGLKLKQTLILTPGQNLYIVEIDGKRLLLGGTHQGGVQFLADLTSTTMQTKAQSNLEFKQIEENNVHMQEFTPFNVDKFHNPNKDMTEKTTSTSKEHPFLVTNQTSASEGSNGTLNQVSQTLPRASFKKRTNFRQSLLSNVK